MGVIPTIYHCGYANCSAKFKKKLRFESHQRMHTGERPFTCSHDGCDRSFTNPSHLKRHELTHDTQFRCKVQGCAMILKTKDTLRKHKEHFHGKKKPKTYKCTICDAQFNKHNWLRSHIARHTGEAPQACPVEGCEKRFAYPSKLKKHMKVHEGYPCKDPNCDKVFPNWSTLVKHRSQAHFVAAAPVLACEICDKKFNYQCNLRAHMMVHREERDIFKCEVPNCSRFYFFQRNLREHMRSFHKRLPFMCDRENCNRAFKTEAQLAEHQLYHGRKKPRWKEKKHKPTFAAILAGCVEPKVINRKPAAAQNTSKTGEECDTSLHSEVEVSEELPKTPSMGTLLKNTVDDNKDNSESCMSLLEAIINDCARET